MNKIVFVRQFLRPPVDPATDACEMIKIYNGYGYNIQIKQWYHSPAHTVSFEPDGTRKQKSWLVPTIREFNEKYYIDFSGLDWPLCEIPGQADMIMSEIEVLKKLASAMSDEQEIYDFTELEKSWENAKTDFAE